MSWETNLSPRSVQALIVFAHVLTPSLDLLGLLLIHSGDFISGVAKRIQDFIYFRVDGLGIAMPARCPSIADYRGRGGWLVGAPSADASPASSRFSALAPSR
jgi:hypothetical protein